jgi:RimJ/RimL family protein N-acetyltransferase
MVASSMLKELKGALEALPEIASIGDIEADNGIIRRVSIEARALGWLTVERLDADVAAALFDFYTEGLSETARRLFAPYPLFDTPPQSADELARRIEDWKREDDWTAINLVKDERIIGFALLKRFRTEHVTSGIAIRNAFHRMGLGSLLQHIIIGQARLLNLTRFHIKVISDNMASIRLHEKCGFKRTRTLPSTMYGEMFHYLSKSDHKSGNEPVDRQLVEMVMELEQ